MILISALAAALLPCLPLLANAQARNTLNVQTYTPEQTTVKDTICELFQGSTRGGVWPETIHSPIDTWNLFEVTPKLVEYLEANGSTSALTSSRHASYSFLLVEHCANEMPLQRMTSLPTSSLPLPQDASKEPRLSYAIP